MRRSTSIRKLTLLILLVLGGALALLHHHPIRVPATEEEAAGTPLNRRESADLLLLIDSEVVAASGSKPSFDEQDLSYGWINLADQEVGSFAVLGPGELQLDALRGRRVVVVTRSAVRASELWLPQLKLFVADGGVLVVERPTSRWELLTGLEVEAGASRPLKELTGLRLANVQEMTGMPWVTTHVPLRVVRGDVEVLAEAVGQPVITRRPLGRGQVIALGFDAGRQITALQQGTAKVGTRDVEDRYPGLLRPGLRTEDLVADSRLLAATVPYADLFERFLLTLLEGATPLPRWWLFPDSSSGAFLMTHDEGGMGDRAFWAAQIEQEQEVPATWFLAQGPHLTPAGMERLSPKPGRGATVGLTYDLGPAADALDEPTQVFGLTVLRRQLPLLEQADWLQSLASRPLRYSRTRDLRWGPGYAQPFAALAAAGIRIDSSYGPASGRGQGYLFGTGLPFLVLDSRGLPFDGLRELPVVVSFEGRKLAREVLERLLRESAETYHQAVTCRVSEAAYATDPDVEHYRLWRSGLTSARRLGLWVTDLASYDQFLTTRRAGSLSSTFDGTMLMVTAKAAGDRQTLALPAQWAGRPAGPVEIGSLPATPRRLAAPGGDLLLLNLPRGTSTVLIEYLGAP